MLHAGQKPPSNPSRIAREGAQTVFGVFLQKRALNPLNPAKTRAKT